MKKTIFFIAALSTFGMAAIAQRQRVQTKEDSLVRQYQNEANTPEGLRTVKQRIQDLANANEEKDLSLAVRLAGAIRQSALADSLNKVQVKRFPNGHAAMIAGYNAMVNEHGSAAQTLAMYNTWIKKFPEPADNQDIVYDYARTLIAGAYAEERDVKNNALWIDRIKNKAFKSTVQRADADIFALKGDFNTAEDLLRKGIANAKANLATNENPGAKGDYNSFLVTYAALLVKEKKYQEALAPITEAYNESANKNASLKETYAVVLANNGRGSEVVPILEELVKNGRASQADKDALRLGYLQRNGNESGFENYMSSLTSVMKATVSAKLAKQMIDQQAPAFTLVDLEGKTVSLEALKGKVVILDFWATWCGPCKKSFPAMQRAVNKYKADPLVKFLFIDTWERIPDSKPQVQAFITDNKYPFQVLLDNSKTKVVDNYGISGIPAKFVIDGKGHIRFKLTGFDGSDDAAVEELSGMIEAAKKAG